MAVDQQGRLPFHLVNQCLVVTIPARLDYFKSEWLQAQILAQITEKKVLGVIVDLSINEIIDLSTMEKLIQLARMSRLLGTTCVLIGLRAPLVYALMDYELDIHDLVTARTLEDGLALFVSVESELAIEVDECDDHESYDEKTLETNDLLDIDLGSLEEVALEHFTFEPARQDEGDYLGEP
ncbi:MAG: STAS domain-containing protein [Pseudomonadales bacterium]